MCAHSRDSCVIIKGNSPCHTEIEITSCIFTEEFVWKQQQQQQQSNISVPAAAVGESISSNLIMDRRDILLRINTKEKIVYQQVELFQLWVIFWTCIISFVLKQGILTAWWRQLIEENNSNEMCHPQRCQRRLSPVINERLAACPQVCSRYIIWLYVLWHVVMIRCLE